MDADTQAAAVILAAGAGRRLGAEVPKAFLTIGDRPMLAVAAAAAAASPAIAAIVVTAPPGYTDAAQACLEGLPVPATVVDGGATRQASVRAALAVLDGPQIVAVHDAARPFAPPDLFTDVVRAVAAGADGAIPVVATSDTVKRLDGLRVVDTIPRDDLGLAQTPQAFRVTALRAAHDEATRAGYDVTDDAMLLERVGSVVALPGDPRNFKITTMLDLARAEARIGGVDA
ncbi:MAG TPA: 2-C-methyl-D-erythritol 4-phosphate cytidylyltransferase [Actinomycetota bacterium]|jgi:2-C-methyl-D-erythritol 4-phosphate cytidylyltransferase|nr:2-C-methyl-D-erythritol 4-phosphate cytidylyltransferase [Actinomycetota bacterium]